MCVNIIRTTARCVSCGTVCESKGCYINGDIHKVYCIPCAISLCKEKGTVRSIRSQLTYLRVECYELYTSG